MTTKSNKLVILDLDATLISAQSLDKFKSEKKNAKKATKFSRRYTMEDYYEILVVRTWTFFWIFYLKTLRSQCGPLRRSCTRCLSFKILS